MPRAYIEAHLTRFPDARPPFDTPQDINILLEIGALSERDARPGPDGATPVAALLETVLADGLERGDILDAVVAASEAQRREMWARREAAAELSRLRTPLVDNDIAVSPDRMQCLIEAVTARARALDPGITFLNVAHLGDGNLHFAGWPESRDPEVHRAIQAAVAEETVRLGGSFSAEHGIGLTKLDAMARHKDTVATDAMRAIRQALDPKGIMNPGKLLP